MLSGSGRASSSASKYGNKKGGKGGGTSWLRIALEGVFFIGWLFCTGVAGYFVGHTQQLSNPADCPPIPQQAATVISADGVASQKPCIKKAKKSGTSTTASHSTPGYSYEEMNRMWTCSHAEADFKQVNQQIFPKENDLDKTKWKSILTVEPKAFFDKYLSQYPGDTRAVQPVVVFSHKPLNSVDEIPDVCKVIDVAIVPDTPGVCVAVTETFHDVASYHMLHADKQLDGSFALTSNSIEGRTLPEEHHYASARALLLDFFSHSDEVNKAAKEAPKFGDNKIGVGILIESKDELELFQNSYASARKAGISASTFCVFTSDGGLKNEVKAFASDVKVVHMPYLAKVGTKGSAAVSSEMRRNFLSAWLAFGVASAGKPNHNFSILLASYAM